MQGVLARLQRDLGITFVYVTHSQSEAFAMADRVVIMSQGVIEQSGSPREVYRNPATRFVAEFVGTNNIISGHVVEAGGGGMIVTETPVGRFACTTDASRSVGDAASFVISADLVTLSTEPPSQAAGENTLECRFISEEFVGSIVTLFLEAPDGAEFRVQKQQRDLAALHLETGAPMYASWSPEHAHILPGK